MVWNAVHGRIDHKFEPHGGYVDAHLEKAFYCNFPYLAGTVALLAVEMHHAGNTGCSRGRLNTIVFLNNRKNCRDKAKPHNYKNHIFENIDSFILYCCSTRKQLNQIFFSLALK